VKVWEKQESSRHSCEETEASVSQLVRVTLKFHERMVIFFKVENNVLQKLTPKSHFLFCFPTKMWTLNGSINQISMENVVLEPQTWRESQMFPLWISFCFLTCSWKFFFCVCSLPLQTWWRQAALKGKLSLSYLRRWFISVSRLKFLDITHATCLLPASFAREIVV